MNDKNNTTMETGDKIIWHSGFGYDIGYYVGESDDIMYNSYEIELVSGIILGKTLRDKDQVVPYTASTMTEMVEEYGYEKKF